MAMKRVFKIILVIDRYMISDLGLINITPTISNPVMPKTFIMLKLEYSHFPFIPLVNEKKQLSIQRQK